LEKRKLEEGRAPETLRLWLLGGFRVSVGSRSIEEEEWHLRKAVSLLKLLTLAPGHRLHREQAMELLWPDLDPEAALNNLHYALHVARRTLEASTLTSAASRYLLLRGEQLALCLDSPLWVDVEAFEEAAATARHALEPAAFRAAIDRYHPRAGACTPRFFSCLRVSEKTPSRILGELRRPKRQPGEQPAIGIS
jgi:DNA-binding SARP family transcriptional activator